MKLHRLRLFETRKFIKIGVIMRTVYNIIAFFALVGSLSVIFGTAYLVVTPPADEWETLPTLVEFPTLPPSRTPAPTLTPTLTHTPTATFTATATVTDSPSLTPSLTLVPTDTPTLTMTPSPSPTATASLTPTISPFPFILQDTIYFEQNSLNALGCDWQGMGGQVVDTSGNPYGIGTLQVHVFDDSATIDRTVMVGSSSSGQVSWEVALDSTINNLTYSVELQNETGTVISPTYRVTFPQLCTENVAIVNFRQNPAQTGG
jgi:hypothetical protein